MTRKRSIVCSEACEAPVALVAAVVDGPIASGVAAGALVNPAAVVDAPVAGAPVVAASFVGFQAWGWLRGKGEERERGER